MARLRLAAVLAVLVFALLPSCHSYTPESSPASPIPPAPPPDTPPIERDLEAIRAAGEIVMLTPTNSTSYFLYRGEPLGFEFELLRQFAESQGLKLRVEIVGGTADILPRLNRGDGDIAAGRLARTPEGEQLARFTQELYHSDPVLVQQDEPVAQSNLPDDAKDAAARKEADRVTEVRSRLVEKPWELSGKEVEVPEESAHKRTLIELNDELSGDVQVVEVETDDEDLVKRVAEGETAYTVAEGNVAELKAATYTNLKIRPVLGRPHRVAWAVRRNAPELLHALDAWIEGRKDDASYQALYYRYFGDSRAYKERAKSEYLTAATGKLCQYDALLKKYAPTIGWDWRLLAAQAYQESRFDPRAKSWAGALGLLQLMPGTAKQFGVKDPYQPEDNVQGAVRFLAWLVQRWEKTIPDERERLSFILASYNCGPGHIDDAQRLAEKYGGDPKRWRDVSYWLLEKSKSSIAADPAVKFGFCRGIEPVLYVDKILGRFEHYKRFVKG
jgi:membrane-bound lytic murein transglycosylase F